MRPDWASAIRCIDSVFRERVRLYTWKLFPCRTPVWQGKSPCLTRKILVHPASPGYEYRFLSLGLAVVGEGDLSMGGVVAVVPVEFLGALQNAAGVVAVPVAAHRIHIPVVARRRFPLPYAGMAREISLSDEKNSRPSGIASSAGGAM